jgi:LysM repeat protein
MVQTNKRMMRRVFLMLILTCVFMSGAILHAYAGVNTEESGESTAADAHQEVSYVSQSAPKTAAVVSYTVDVCPGDTLWDIASAHMPKDGNIRSYINKIKKINNLKSSDIRAGQILVLP